jgi:hypothetical protein
MPLVIGLGEPLNARGNVRVSPSARVSRFSLLPISPMTTNPV